MNDLISRQAVLDIVDDLRDRMTVEGYWSMVERIKALPSATCGNLEKPEIPQHSEGEAADCNLDCISRQMLLEYIHGEPVGKLLCDKYNLDGLIEQFPSVQPNLQPTCNQLATDCISRQAVIDALQDRYKLYSWDDGGAQKAEIGAIIREIYDMPSAQPEERTEERTETHSCDCISRQAAIDEIEERKNANGYRNVAVISELNRLEGYIMRLSSAQPVDKDIDVPSTDTISRQDAIRIVDGIDTWQAGWRGNAIESIKALPSEQPEIVACGDCKHWICHDRRCDLWNHGVKPLDWCCHGERRTDE